MRENHESDGFSLERVYVPVSRKWRNLLGSLKKPALLYRSLGLVRCEFQISGDGSCVYIGEGLSLPYYQKLYGCEANPQVQKVSLHNLRQEIARAQARSPLVLVEVNQWLERFLLPGYLLTYPWIRQITDLQGERYQQRKRGIERGFGQRVRRHNLQVRFTREAKDVEVFYHEYYLPHIRARHGSLAIGRALPQLKEAVRSGFLLQIWWRDQWVSGVVAQWAESDRVSPLSVGLHPNHLDSWQNGTLAACYYFLFRWALENGVRWVDFGGSPPHLLSGVYRHKALWAAEPERDSWHHTQLALYLNPSTPLPEVVTQQLIWRQGQFVSIAESLQAELLNHQSCATHAEFSG